MGTYNVSYPTVGEVVVEVEADSEDEAIEAGWDLVGDASVAEHQWEAVTKIVQGNVFYGPLNSIYAELIDDGEEDDD
jgi:hypothetical protein